MKIKKINKNYYGINTRPVCSVFLDEFLMKKANKILYKYHNEMDTLLKNNPKHLIKESWALAYPNGEQTSFYGTNLKPPEKVFTPKFNTVKINDLFYIGNKSIYSNKVTEEVKKLLEMETSE